MGIYASAISRAINSAEFDYHIATLYDCTYWMQATFQAAYGAFCKRHFAANARRLAQDCMSAAVAAERRDQFVVSDLNRGALSDLLRLPPEIERSHSAAISPAMIAAAWQENAYERTI